MKNDRVGRAGVLAVAVVGVLAASWLLPPVIHKARRLCPVRPDGVPEAGAYATFARRYGVSCSVCHNSVPQLNTTGYKFRTSGYRMPDEIGSDAKWSNWGDNMSVRTQENYNVTSTQGHDPRNAATNGFVNGGLEMYPLEGAFGKYVSANDEIDFTAANAPTLMSLNLVATLPVNADSFVTVRSGLISAFQGYGAADAGIGIVNPTFTPTPSQVQPGSGGLTPFTYPGFGASGGATGEGVEVAYNWKDTHVSAQVTNGYNSFKNSAIQGEDNHYKDYGVFVNQLIGENGISAWFYKGTSGYDFNAKEAAGTPLAANWYDNYTRLALYGTIKALSNDKLDLLLGLAQGTDHTYDLNTNSSSPQFHSLGWYATLQSIQHVLNQQLTTALSYGTNRVSTATAGNRVSDVTLSFAVPIENNKFAFDVQTQRMQSAGHRDVIAQQAQVQWQFMY